MNQCPTLSGHGPGSRNTGVKAKASEQRAAGTATCALRRLQREYCSAHKTHAESDGLHPLKLHWLQPLYIFFYRACILQRWHTAQGEARVP